jgi:thiosulfate dehydrogenase [quinone] large subunit
MSEANRTSGKVGLALLLLRVPLGLFFLLAGLHKVQGGVGDFVSGASGLIPSFLPNSVGRAYLYAVPWAEIIVGICLIAGLFGRFIAMIVSLMLISFMIAATGIKPSGKEPLQYNIVLLGISLCLMLLGPGNFSADAFLPEKRKKQ